MKHFTKYLFLTFFFLSTGTKIDLPGEHIDYAPLHGETLSCMMPVRDARRVKQYHTGYHYQILREFVKNQHCSLNLLPLPFDSTSVWEALYNKEVRIIVFDSNRDTIPEYIENQIVIGPSLNDQGHVWVFLKDDFEVMQAMHTWFSSFKYTERYSDINQRFYMVGTHSPYDEIIKSQSKVIGWDWRLVSALIHQESGFRMNVTSPKGAAGLMQVLQSTAEKYGTSSYNLYDPEENIKAGTLFLQDLTKLFSDSLLVDSEKIKFVLAAYNAGSEQIRICREFAAYKGKNPNLWSDVADVIPLMREDEYEHLFSRRFLGDETIRYVKEVLAKYERYCEYL